MSFEGLQKNLAVAPIDSGSKAPPSIPDALFDRVSDQTSTSARPAPDAQELSGLRRISPEFSSTSPAAVQTAGNSDRTTGFFDRLFTMFGKPATDAPGKDTVSFAADKDQKKAVDLDQAVDRLERSQDYATGMALMSSLTQSVMSASRRLTQGQ